MTRYPALEEVHQEREHQGCEPSPTAHSPLAPEEDSLSGLDGQNGPTSEQMREGLNSHITSGPKEKSMVYMKLGHVPGHRMI